MSEVAVLATIKSRWGHDHRDGMKPHSTVDLFTDCSKDRTEPTVLVRPSTNWLNNVYTNNERQRYERNIACHDF